MSPPKRRRPPAARARRRDALLLAGAVLFLALCFGKLEAFAGWDETFYLGQLSSLVEDGDVDVRNDALHSRLVPLELRRLLVTTLPGGGLMNTFGIGQALVYAPAYLAALPLRPWLGPERWNRAQLAALHLLALALTFAVVWFLFLWLRRAGLGRRRARLAALALLLGTPLLIYGVRSYTMSHLASAVAACLLVAAVHRLERRPTSLSAAACGVALGLAALVRWQDLLLGVILAVPAARLWRARAPLRRWLALAAAGGAGFVFVAALQCRVWGIERGEFLALPQGSDYFRLGAPRLGEFLFSGLSGLVPWTPLLALATAGLLLPWRLRLPRTWAWSGLAAILLQIYLSAAVADWWAGASYGQRRLTSTLPLVALGVANLVRRRGARWAPVVLALVCGWGLFTASVYRRGVQDLAPIFLGRPAGASSSGADRAGAIVQDPAAARRVARSWPLNPRLPDYRARLGEPPGAAGRALTLVLMASTVLGVALCAARPRRRRTRSMSAASATLVVVGALAALAHLRLAFGARPDPAERAAWREFALAAAAPRPDYARLDREIERLDAAGDAAPEAADAYRYVHLFSLWQRRLPGRGATALQALAARGLPAAEELERWAAAAGPGGRMLVVVPGRAGGVGPDVPPRRVVLRRIEPLATRALAVDFELELGGPAAAPAALVALVANDAPIFELGLAADGAATLRTALAEARVPGPWARGGRYQVRLVWRRPEERVDLEIWQGPARLRALSALGARAAAPRGEMVLRLGGTPPAGTTAAGAAPSAAVLDLRVAVAADPLPVVSKPESE